MWMVNKHSLQMTEGDWGVELPISINGVTLTDQDEVLFTVKTVNNGTKLLEKTFSNITDNTVRLSFTEAESALLPRGVYVYSLDWYQNNVFFCNIIPSAEFKVVDKA